MSFTPAGNFLLIAAQKYKLKDQAVASLMKERVNQWFELHFPAMRGLWRPLKFIDSDLTIAVTDSASASQLFLWTHTIIERMNADETIPRKIVQIKIQREIEKEEPFPGAQEPIEHY